MAYVALRNWVLLIDFGNLILPRTTSNDLFTILGALYGATIFICFNNCGTVQPVVSIERTVFYREKAAGMYSAIPYALAQASSLSFCYDPYDPFSDIWAVG
jgi:hypothetical protein